MFESSRRLSLSSSLLESVRTNPRDAQVEYHVARKERLLQRLRFPLERLSFTLQLSIDQVPTNVSSFSNILPGRTERSARSARHANVESEPERKQ